MEYGLGLILSITALVFGLPFFIRGLRLKLKKGKEYRGLLVIIFGVYMLGYLYYTLLSRDVMPSARIQLVFLRGYRTAFAFDSGIFGALKEMLTEGPVSGLSGIHFVSTEPLEGVILNILLYIPMGYLLPVLWSSLAQGKWMWKILLAGFAASLLTEIVQLILRLGWFDVDDLLNNMLGILAGLWLYRKFLAEMHRVERKVRRHGRKAL